MSYNLLVPFQFVTAQSLGASFISQAQEVKLQDNIGIQLNWTGTPAGAFDFQVSMDYAEDINGNITHQGHWISLVLDPAIVAAGAPDSAYIDFNQLSTPYIRIVYTRTSGTGLLDAYIVAKGV